MRSSKTHIPFLTDTVKRFTVFNVIIFLILFAVFNVMLISITSYVLHENLDNRLVHEIENIVASLKIEDGKIEIINFAEFNEPDLKTLTENPYFLQIYDSAGNIIITSDNIHLYKSIPIDYNYSPTEFESEDIEIENDDLRVGYIPLFDNNNELVATLQLAIFELEYEVIRNKAILYNLISFPIAVLLVIFSSILLAKKSFSPINKIIDIANNISAKNLNQRIDIQAKQTDEIGRLRDTLNSLFDRIENYVDEVSNFTDQASHQLMNPLTAIISELEYLLKRDRSIEEYNEALSLLHKQTENMISIVKTLLIIAQSDKRKIETQSVINISALVKNEIRPFYGEENIKYEIEPDIYIRGEFDKFLMVFQNLLTNSIKFSEISDEISVKLKRMNQAVQITIADTGLGIPDSEKEKVFERFYRSESTEKLGIKGYGLGLSLVKSIINEVRGKIIIEDNQPKGVIVTITLPIVEIN